MRKKGLIIKPSTSNSFAVVKVPDELKKRIDQTKPGGFVILEKFPESLRLKIEKEEAPTEPRDSHRESGRR